MLSGSKFYLWYWWLETLIQSTYFRSDHRKPANGMQQLNIVTTVKMLFICNVNHAIWCFSFFSIEQIQRVTKPISKYLTKGVHIEFSLNIDFGLKLKNQKFTRFVLAKPNLMLFVSHKLGDKWNNDIKLKVQK